MASQMLPINDRMRINWTSMMERYFIDLMLDQLHRGNRMGHTFNKQAWTDMLTMFNSRFGTKYDRDTLKSHYSNLWKQYNDVKNLLEQSGFSWDDNRKMVVASDDAWATIIKVWQVIFHGLLFFLPLALWESKLMKYVCRRTLMHSTTGGSFWWTSMICAWYLHIQ